MSFERNLSHDGKLTLVELKGELEITVTEQFLAELRQLLDEGRRHLYIDLAGIQGIDSSGIGLLCRLHDLIRKMDGTLTLRRPPDQVYRVFEITRLSTFFDFVKNPAEAIAIVGRSYQSSSITDSGEFKV